MPPKAIKKPSPDTAVTRHKNNFTTLQKAFAAKEVLLRESLHIETNQRVAVICAVNQYNQESVITPFAMFFNGNPFEMLAPPADGTADGFLLPNGETVTVPMDAPTTESANAAKVDNREKLANLRATMIQAIETAAKHKTVELEREEADGFYLIKVYGPFADINGYASLNCKLQTVQFTDLHPKLAFADIAVLYENAMS